MRRIRAFFKRLGRGIGHFFTHWSVKKVIIVIIVLVAGFFGVRALLSKVGGANAAMAAAPRTILLTRSNLSENVTVTGTVESASVADVTSSAAQKVKEVLVKEGDSVVAGQTLCLLDTTELDKQIKKEKTSLGDAVKLAQKNLVEAQGNYNEAVAAQTEAYDKACAQELVMKSATDALNSATAPYNTAKASVYEYQSVYDTAYREQQAAGTALNSNKLVTEQQALQAAQAIVDTAQATFDRANTAWLAAASPAMPDPLCEAKDTAQTALNSVKITYEAAKAALDAATAALLQEYNDKTAAVTAADAALKLAKTNSNYATLEGAYNAAKSGHDAARNMLDSLESVYKASAKTTENAKKAIETAQDNFKKAGTSDALDKLQEQLDACTITATTGGTITAINATVGSLPGGAATGSATLFAIQDTDHLKVTVNIDPYDITKVKSGMDTEILSDATGEKAIKGYVSQISLTATTTQTATGFGAEVTVDGTNSGLLIGTSAKVKIILNSKDNVYSVPYDAIGKDEQGNSVIYVKQEDGSFLPVIVTTGVETDYYVEISGADLAEGMEVRNSADESSVTAANSDMMMGGGGGGAGQVVMTTGPAPAGAAGRVG